MQLLSPGDGGSAASSPRGPASYSPSAGAGVLRDFTSLRKGSQGPVQQGFKRSIITIDLHGTIVSCNNAARYLFGYPVGSLVGRPVAALMPEPIAARHQSYVQRHVDTGKNHGGFGAWTEREARTRLGEKLIIRVSLSKATLNGQPAFSALIDPVFECAIVTDESGTIVSREGSTVLLFGACHELVGTSVFKLLQNSSCWKAGTDKVVVARNEDGEDFSVTLRVRKESNGLLRGEFSDAPRLKMRVVLDEEGTIVDASGDSYAFIGYRSKALRGMSMLKLLTEEAVSTVKLDRKTVISIRCKNGLQIFASLRLTKVRHADGTFTYEGRLKSAGDGKSVLKGRGLRYDGPVLGWYELGPSLGHGMCGPVRRAVHRLTGEEVAIKTLSRSTYQELGMAFPPPEVSLLARVRHPHLVRVLDTIWTEDEVFLVMEFIRGGEFFEYCAAAALSENKARFYWRQLLSGVDYLHRSMIAHRDIKLENLVLDSEQNLRLVDFGFATEFKKGEKLKLFCVPEDHEVLTSHGWMDLDTYQQHAENVLVAGLDSATNEICFERPCAVHVLPRATRNLVEFRQGKVNYLVTEDHDVFVQTSATTRAQKYPARTFTSLSSWPHRNDIASVRHVRVASKGWRRAQGGEELFGGHCWKELHRYANECFVQGVPLAPWVWNLSSGEMRGLLFGEAARDKENDCCSVIQTPSADVRDQIVRLALLSGMTSSFEWNDHLQSYMIDVGTHVSECSPTSVSTVSVRGRVWCLTMPSGLFWVRRAVKDACGVVTAASQPAVTGNCGSPDYAAPELVGMNEYDGPSVDIWAVGCVLYLMLTGFIPFTSPARILACRFFFPPNQPLSSQAQALLKLIFQPEASRPSMDRLLAHEWTNAGGHAPIERIPVLTDDPDAPEHLHEDIIETMEEQYGWSRDAILSALSAHHVSSQVSTTYHLLDWKKHRPKTGEQPEWKQPAGVRGRSNSESPQMTTASQSAPVSSGTARGSAVSPIPLPGKKGNANCVVQ